MASTVGPVSIMMQNIKFGIKHIFLFLYILLSIASFYITSMFYRFSSFCLSFPWKYRWPEEKHDTKIQSIFNYCCNFRVGPIKRRLIKAH